MDPIENCNLLQLAQFNLNRNWTSTNEPQSKTKMEIEPISTNLHETSTNRSHSEINPQWNDKLNIFYLRIKPNQNLNPWTQTVSNRRSSSILWLGGQLQSTMVGLPLRVSVSRNESEKRSQAGGNVYYWFDLVSKWWCVIRWGCISISTKHTRAHSHWK